MASNPSSDAPKRLILIGAGHAHAEVLAGFARRRSALGRCDVALTVISPGRLAPYSGMIPGWLAGAYHWEECCIDFAALAASAGARFIQSEVLGIESSLDPGPESGPHCFTLANGEKVIADIASLNIGSTVAAPVPPEGGPSIIPMRPLSFLRARVEQLDLSSTQGAPVSIVAVGGGAAGMESILALKARYARAGIATEANLVTRTAQLLPGFSRSAVMRAEGVLRGAGVSVQKGFDVSAVDATGLCARDGRHIDARLILWATGGKAHAWPALSGLAVDAGGFIRVDRYMRSLSHPWLYAAGDCAAFEKSPGTLAIAKSGVSAVRMGPVLNHNLNVTLTGSGHLQEFQAQRRQLALLNCANGKAIAAWGPMSVEGRWMWRWKDHIDRSFLRRYQVTD